MEWNVEVRALGGGVAETNVEASSLQWAAVKALETLGFADSYEGIYQITIEAIG